MVTTPMMQNAIKVTLPEGQAKEADGNKQELIVYIDKSGSMFFNGVPVTKDNVAGTVKKKVGNDTQCTVFVKADQSVPYGLVIETVDQLKMAGGVKYVALATKKLPKAVNLWVKLCAIATGFHLTLLFSIFSSIKVITPTSNLRSISILIQML